MGLQETDFSVLQQCFLFKIIRSQLKIRIVYLSITRPLESHRKVKIERILSLIRRSLNLGLPQSVRLPNALVTLFIPPSRDSQDS